MYEQFRLTTNYQQEWSRIRRTKKKVENWLQGVTSWIVVHATTTVVYYTVVIVSVIVMVVVIVIVHVMVDVALSPPMVVVTATVSSSSSPPHPCRDMDPRDPRKSAASVPVMTWISFKKHWNAMHTFFEIRNYMYISMPSQPQTQLCCKQPRICSTSKN